MLFRLNPQENVLRRPRICMNNRITKDSQKRKSHVTFGTVKDTKVVFVLFSLILLVTNITIPKHGSNPNATYTKQVVNRFHELNEL